MDVKPLDSSASKFSTNAANAASEYAERAAGAADKWSRETQASAANYRTAVTAGNIEARFRRGVQKAGASKYQSKITQVGQGRFSEGVAGAGDDWSSGFGPYQQALGSMTLGARRPRGDAANYARVKQIGDALHARRLATLAGGT
jgi:hypothetical protein